MNRSVHMSLRQLTFGNLLKTSALTAALATKAPAVQISFEMKAYSLNPILLPVMELLHVELIVAQVKQQIRYWFITFRDSLPGRIHMVGFVAGLGKSNIWPVRCNITEGQITRFRKEVI